MKKSVIIFIALLLITTAVYSTAYKVPARLAYASEQLIYPIGWSKNGNFAYVIYYDIGSACGFCPFYKLIIQSAVTDKILTENTYEAYSNKKKSGKKEINEIWKEIIASSQKELNKYQIIQDDVFHLDKPEFIYKNISYQIKYQYRTGSYQFQAFEAPSVEETFISKGTLTLYSSARGKKIVFRYNRKNYDTVIDAAPAGYLSSPYENRIVILFTQKYLDGDGTQREKLRFIGAHLTKGF